MIKKIRSLLNLMKKQGTDRILYVATLFLCGFGIIMIGDVCVGMTSTHGSGYATINIIKQAIFVVAGLFAMLVVAGGYKKKWYNERNFYIFYAFILLLMGICRMWTINSSHAWIILGPITIQPAEFMKVILIILLSYNLGYLPLKYSKEYYINRSEESTYQQIRFTNCIAIPAGLAFLAFGVCAIWQKDLGSALIILFISYMVFLATPGTYFKRFKRYTVYAIGALIVLAVPLSLLLKPHQLARIISWLRPLDDIYGTSYQLVNGFVAFSNGGLFGLGFGNSHMKFGFIPEAQNDFISAIIVEELGLIGYALILIPYAAIIFKLFRYAFKVQETHEKLILIGIASYFFAHLFVNIGGVSGLIPMTGVPLLLISAGGTSTIAALMSIGLAQGIISKYNRHKMKEEIENQL